MVHSVEGSYEGCTNGTSSLSKMEVLELTLHLPTKVIYAKVDGNY